MRGERKRPDRRRFVVLPESFISGPSTWPCIRLQDSHRFRHCEHALHEHGGRNWREWIRVPLFADIPRLRGGQVDVAAFRREPGNGSWRILPCRVRGDVRRRGRADGDDGFRVPGRYDMESGMGSPLRYTEESRRLYHQGGCQVRRRKERRSDVSADCRTSVSAGAWSGRLRA